MQDNKNDLAILELEKGNYAEALRFGLLHPYDLGRCFLFLYKTKELKNILNQICQDKELIFCELLKIQQLRMQGASKQALDYLQEQISKNKNIFLESERLPLRLSGEAFLQLASCHFNAGEYQAAIHLWQNAFEKFESADRPYRMASTAFNIAVAASYLNLLEIKNSWLWTAQNLLKNLDFNSLENSIELFLIETDVASQNYRSALNLGEKYLKKHGTSEIQKILCYQALCRCFLEAGEVNQSLKMAKLSERLIQQKNFKQYEPFQIALELELETVTLSLNHTKKFFEASIKTMDPRAKNKIQKAQKFYNYFTNREFHIDGLLINSNLEFIFYNAIEQNTLEKLTLITESLELKETLSATEEILYNLAKGLLHPSKKKNINSFKKPFELSKKTGHKRLELVALSLCAQSDPEYLQEWHLFYSNLPDVYKNWFQRTLAKTLGVSTPSAVAFINSTTQQLHIFDIQQSYPKSIVPFKKSLLIFEPTSEVYFLGQKINFGKSSLLYEILKQIARSEKNGIHKETLIQKIWGYEYSPLTHDSLIYTNMRRLREWVPIVLTQDRYHLPKELQWSYFLSKLDQDQDQEQDYYSLRPSKLLTHQESKGTEERSHQLVKLLRDKIKISRSEAVKALQVSERTALRELNSLLEKKYISKSGAGRGTKYYLINEEGF